MKKLILFCLILLYLTAFNTKGQAIQWAQMQEVSTANSGPSIFAPHITSDGRDVISCGIITTSITFGGKTFTNTNTRNGYLAKHDQDGTLMWAKHIKGSVYGLRAVTDSHKNIFVTGQYFDSLHIDNTLFTNTIPNSPCTFFTAKFNERGSLLWARKANQTVFSELTALTTDGSGNVYITGWYEGTFSIGSAMVTSLGMDDIFLAKYDTNGNFQWLKSIGGSGQDRHPSIVGGLNNEVYLALSSNSPIQPGNSNFYGSHLKKFNNSGQEIWSKPVSGRGAFYHYHLSIDAAENIYMSGVVDSTVTFDNVVLKPFQGNRKGTFLAKIDVNGRWNWAKIIPNSHTWPNYFVIEPQTRGQITLASYEEHVIGHMDRKLIKADTSGNVLKTISFSNNGGNTSGPNTGSLGLYSSATNNIGDTYLSGYLFNRMSIGQFAISPPHGMTGINGQNVNASFIAKLMGNANAITGILFIDANGNGIMETGEKPFENGILEVSPSSTYAITKTDGTFTAFVPSGNFNLKVTQPAVHYTFSPQNHSVSFAGNGQTQTRDFALVPIPNRNDVKIIVTNLTAARPGFMAKYRITFENVGTTTLSDSIVLKYDSNYLTFTTALPPAASTASGRIQWLYHNLEPMEKRNIDLEFTVAVSTPLGTTLNTIAVIGPLKIDFISENNIDTLNHVVTGSFDPNDKQVNLNRISLAQVANGNYLDYTIRFQNTGTDTAFTVIVRDSISSKLNTSTLELLSASHPYTFRFLENGQVEWRFDNILLPDSNRNEPGSHGFIRYRMQPKNNLRLGEVIQSRAAIYFDYNSPIYTNQAITRVTKTKKQRDDLEFDLYPNPAKTYVMVAADLKKPTAATVRLVNILGQTISKVTLPANSQLHYQLPLNNLPKGVYIVQLETEQGRQAQRLVVQ